MTFEELRDTIVANAKAVDICPGLNRAKAASSYSELLAAGASIIEWAYHSGAVPDVLVAEFPEYELNAVNIYSTGSALLTNPSGKIYALKEADLTIDFSQPTDCEIVVMGAANVTINGSSFGTGSIFLYDNATLTADLTDDSFLAIQASQESHYEITSENDGMLRIEAYGTSTGVLTLADATASKINLWNEAQINITETGTPDTKTYTHSPSATIIRPET
jgi:hypothetical protein